MALKGPDNLLYSRFLYSHSPGWGKGKGKAR